MPPVKRDALIVIPLGNNGLFPQNFVVK